MYTCEICINMYLKISGVLSDTERKAGLELIIKSFREKMERLRYSSLPVPETTGEISAMVKIMFTICLYVYLCMQLHIFSVNCIYVYILYVYICLCIYGE